MNRLTLYLYGIGLAAGIIGCCYFLLLVIHLPVVITAVVIFAAVALLFRRLHQEGNDLKNADSIPFKTGITACLLMVFITIFAILRARKYGDWDAIYIWNLAAKFLKEPTAWQHLFAYRSIETHTDYPLLIPANVAFWWRITGGEPVQIVPFLVGLLFTLLTPLLVFYRLAKQHFNVALVASLLLTINPFFLNIGLDQFADVPLSFFFLCAFTARDEGLQTQSPTYFAICSAMLGCCLWTKNEGSMLAILFLLFNERTIFKTSRRFGAFLTGIILPLSCLILFKAVYAPGNDLIAGQKTSLLSLLTDGQRYKTIALYCLSHLRPECYLIFGLLLLWTIFALLKKSGISKDILLIATCIAGYLLVYLLTPRDLDWHLSNSIDRVLLHLMPATVYILGREAIKYSEKRLLSGIPQ